MNQAALLYKKQKYEEAADIYLQCIDKIAEKTKEKEVD